jgi:outer membrane protein assembly factor BamE (lipoprotein component of BamABCDE complex)
MRILLLIILTFLISCSSGSKAISMDDYSYVTIGMSKDELIQKMGKPYSIKNLSYNQVEYIYIEKINANQRVLLERKYLFILENDQVTSKKVIDINRPSWERNSYEMQTE